ncbi:MAG TPA: VanZ family protein [Gaiellaceae bacterium]|jgi:VanZ family protein|nr:VanZ family protein [Gaiellaceae bacterium]
MALSRRFSLWAPVLLWAAVIFALSSIPSLGTGLGVWDTILRKGAHITEYAILALLLLRAIGREAPAFLLGLAYSATDELHQHFVRGRHASPVDVAIDALGLLLGLLVFHATVESAAWPTERASTTGSSTRSSSGSMPSEPSSRR